MTEQTVLALITCQTYPEPPDNLKTLAACLENMGVKTIFDAWQNHPSAPFLLPLCAWDYAAEPEAFRQWLEQAEQVGQRFINPPELMAWNMEKTYLCDLAERGARVIPSVFVPPQKAELSDILNQQGWPNAVIKPAFGQSGKGVVNGQANTVTYSSAASLVTLSGNAKVQRGGDVAEGAVITYNTKTEVYTINASAKSGVNSAAKSGRFSVVIQPSSTQKNK